MSHIPLEELLKPGQSLYQLVLATSKRTLELSEGAPSLILATEGGLQKPAEIALEEFRQGKVTYRMRLRPAADQAGNSTTP